MNERETRVRFTDPARINPEPLLTRIQSDPGRYRANSNSAITINYPETETNSDGIALSGEERFTAHLAELEAILTEITP